jgi:hypothetical protein
MRAEAAAVMIRISLVVGVCAERREPMNDDHEAVEHVQRSVDRQAPAKRL